MTAFPRFPALRGRAALWLREYSDTSERSTENIIATMRQTGFDCLCLKVMDGLRYQGQNDSATPVLRLADIATLRTQLAAAGIALLPVVTPRGLAGEAEAHGAIAADNGCLMTDIEPYQGFWDQAPYALIPVYAQYLRKAAGNAYLINEPDPRQSGWIDGHVVESAQYYDAIAPQNYVGWASLGWADVALEVANYTRQLFALGLDRYTTLYGVERTDLAAQFWRQITDSTTTAPAEGFCAFAMGAMNLAQLQMFGALPGTGAPEPIPGTQDPCAGLTQQVQQLMQQITQLKGDLGTRDFDAKVATELLAHDETAAYTNLQALFAALGGGAASSNVPQELLRLRQLTRLAAQRRFA